MDLIEYLTIVAILDGPIIGLFYLLYRKITNNEIRNS
jgi:hypothetical protein